MSLCTICGRVYCEHTLEERGQTVEEVDRPLTPEEDELWHKELNGSQRLIEMARLNAHLIPK